MDEPLSNKTTTSKNSGNVGVVTTDPAIVIEGSSVGVMGGGIALESLTKADQKGRGKILVFVNLGYQHMDTGSPDTRELAKENESLIARNKEFEERLKALEEKAGK